MPHFVDKIDLAGERAGGQVLSATDDFFASKDNLIKREAAVWAEGKHTDRGKWMDGWESRRKRVPGHDTCTVRLGLPGIVRGVVIDTAFFRGNYPEYASLDGCAAGDGGATAGDPGPEAPWRELLGKVPLLGDTKNLFAVTGEQRVTHVRLHIYPDGGVARLRVHGDVAPDWAALRAGKDPVDLVAAAHGGLALVSSDAFFGASSNLIMPGVARDMSDGWETRRRRGPGHDWLILRLGARGAVERIEVDTSHFKGNYPDRCSLEACDAPEATLDVLASERQAWTPILAESKLEAHAVASFPAAARVVASHVKFRIYPDGGVSRLRLFGRPL